MARRRQVRQDVDCYGDPVWYVVEYQTAEGEGLYTSVETTLVAARNQAGSVFRGGPDINICVIWLADEQGMLLDHEPVAVIYRDGYHGYQEGA